MKKIIEEFKIFISKGNVIDLAIGVIIGGIDFSNLTIKVQDDTISYGLFIQNIIDFLIIAFCTFLFIKIINKFNQKKKKEEPKVINEDIKLLTEIRDINKAKIKKTLSSFIYDIAAAEHCPPSDKLNV